jgi:hypothetical protein
MRDRIIHRPNVFSPEEWEELSREEQIQWHRDDAARQPKGPAPSPLIFLQQYDEGHITKTGFGLGVFEHLTEDNVEEFIDGCRPEVFEVLRQQAEEMPLDIDEYGWSQYVIARMVCYAPWATSEEVEAAEAKWRYRIRTGLKLFRTHISN